MYKIIVNSQKQTYSAIVNDFNYIVHHGIKGQKWGVRRFQNPDGSYTSAGAERYNNRNSDGSINSSKGTSSGGGKSLTGGKSVKTASKSSPEANKDSLKSKPSSLDTKVTKYDGWTEERTNIKSNGKNRCWKNESNRFVNK